LNFVFQIRIEKEKKEAEMRNRGGIVDENDPAMQEDAGEILNNQDDWALREDAGEINY
jgi:hypothetical protein